MIEQDTANKDPLPSHIGIIMDGNGRWAKNKNLPRTMGHKEGLETVKRIVATASELGIKYITLYIFSTENWKRSTEEVGFLMTLIKKHLRAEFEFYKKNHIRILHTGDITGLTPDIRQELESAQKDTENFDGLAVVLAINYGGRDEIIRAIKKIDSAEYSSITQENFTSYFDVPELPDMDMLIRTGGEKRLSNFMLWYTTYTELFFSDVLWPDYTVEDFIHTIRIFQNRDRRFGGINE